MLEQRGITKVSFTSSFPFISECFGVLLADMVSIILREFSL